MDYIEVRISIDPFSEEKAEILMAEIVDLGYESFVTEEPFLKAYIPSDKYSAANLKTVLSAYAPGFGGEGEKIGWEAIFIKEQNWNAAWESNFTPIVVEKGCTIKAPYHKNLPRTRYNITIDPKCAFGTGHHQTTYMMMKALLGYAGKLGDKQILDMGCGTGVLAILCAKMGAKAPVHGVDIDLTSVYSARENAWHNRVSKRCSIICGDASVLQAGKYDMILANINRNILLEDMRIYSRSMRPGAELLLSGFYTKDIPMLLEEASRNHLTYISQDEREEWALLKLRKEDSCNK